MKKFVFGTLIALMLVAAVATPVLAAVNEQNIGASVSVSEVVSITLTDEGAAGLNFGTVAPGTNDIGDAGQKETPATPAIKVNVASETNIAVNIGIKGVLGTETIALSNWKYSQTFVGAKTGLTDSYVGVYTSKTAGTSGDFYHWLDVPSTATAGSHAIQVYYKAQSASF